MNFFSFILNKINRPVFNHKKAQIYEENHARTWIQNNFKPLYDQIITSKTNNTKWAGPDNLIIKEFFDGRIDDWSVFANFITDKTCLDIGCGPCSLLCIWHWVKTKIVIDPLIFKYDSTAKELFSKSWFSDDMVMYSSFGEDFLPDLEGKIDGTIICRNALDHCKKPYKVLENMSKYAKAGCYLLLWTDLYHNYGTDEGHSQLTKSRIEFENNIKELGFIILRQVGNIRNDDSTINYGCLGKKI
jgi:2-polyprenyl-3-methyl-5-hydroxy-6-metoxy-1,4-benzoquinol methylase